MHEYFTHFSSLVNLELHEAVCAGGQMSEQDMNVSLITHKRQVDAIAALCKRGTMLTPLFAIIMAGMGGREGAQSPEEVRHLSCANSGLASDSAVAGARAQLEALGLNESQAAAVGAALTQRLALIQGPPGTGKTKVACDIIKRERLGPTAPRPCPHSAPRVVRADRLRESRRAAPQCGSRCRWAPCSSRPTQTSPSTTSAPSWRRPASTSCGAAGPRRSATT